MFLRCSKGCPRCKDCRSLRSATGRCMCSAAKRHHQDTPVSCLYTAPVSGCAVDGGCRAVWLSAHHAALQHGQEAGPRPGSGRVNSASCSCCMQHVAACTVTMETLRLVGLPVPSMVQVCCGWEQCWQPATEPLAACAHQARLACSAMPCHAQHSAPSPHRADENARFFSSNRALLDVCVCKVALAVLVMADLVLRTWGIAGPAVLRVAVQVLHMRQGRAGTAAHSSGPGLRGSRLQCWHGMRASCRQQCASQHPGSQLNVCRAAACQLLVVGGGVRASAAGSPRTRRCTCAGSLGSPCTPAQQ